MREIAETLAFGLRSHLPPEIGIDVSGTTLRIASKVSKQSGGVDLADFIHEDDDAEGVAFASERVLDAIQDFVATELRTPWPLAGDHRNELPLPQAQQVGEVVIARYFWADGEALDIASIPNS